ncbi:hypothetical protein Bca4012_014947 [Brassica carinata]
MSFSSTHPSFLSSNFVTSECSDRYHGKRNEEEAHRAVLRDPVWRRAICSLMRREDELVGGKRRKTKVISVTVILSGSETRRSQETPPRVLQPSIHLVEGGGGDDGEDALHDAVGSALEDEEKALSKISSVS